MCKSPVIVLLLLIIRFDATAQQTTDIVPSNPVPKAAQADTVRAIQRVFQKHRTGGWIWTAVGGLSALRIASVAAGSSAGAGFSSTTGGSLVGIGLFGGIPAGVGISKLTRFSKAKEEQTVALYTKSAILPPYVRKRLKPKYFDQ